MAVSEIHTLATRVQNRCGIELAEEQIVEFLKPLYNNWDIPEEKLVEKTVAHFENEHLAEGGVILEWDGEPKTMDDALY